MAKGAPSQASSMVPRAGGAAPARTGPVGTTAGNRRRHTTGSSSRSSGGGGQQMGGMGGGGMLRFYTDDAPGLRITPVVVLVMSLCFIGFVTVLHVIGKIYTTRG
uniref:Protein transport protein Sec61 subunit beta n=1 Tax=Pyramimonas obovata TaxID=1411642 RepID=A0A7S0R4M4_9CHLO|mmetsp:Transcript_25724/g.55868  ORF Transcript_25724/g.55868 Transcript_25724/m.55868 type:complete len:105 (+) Transcript_25724:246-560(+)|eukprot:CAMPEP_0118932296 /NCGR_PEP_ID=MMETSP1169-20130426/9783_1 /TAXON_ID=36882 /ORGANISM="Pyramimonas obovata, Strain CCMP722" /LENGTH=104 /DNA_ID=CAMNT_0006874935 /DNA_START=218 /DNA_END=532 /DNA_ORIENTATION=+